MDSFQKHRASQQHVAEQESFKAALITGKNKIRKSSVLKTIMLRMQSLFSVATKYEEENDETPLLGV